MSISYDEAVQFFNEAVEYGSVQLDADVTLTRESSLGLMDEFSQYEESVEIVEDSEVLVLQYGLGDVVYVSSPEDLYSAMA